MHIEPITFIQRENRLETERKTGDDDREYRGVWEKIGRSSTRYRRKKEVEGGRRMSENTTKNKQFMHNNRPSTIVKFSLYTTRKNR